MAYTYPTVFCPEDGGRYSVVIPDLEDLATYGDNLAEAYAMVQKTCGRYRLSLLKDGEALPKPSVINVIKSALSIPSWFNAACEKKGVNFSRILKDALIQNIQNG